MMHPGERQTENADPAELDKFSGMAEHWWDPEGACKPLHRINPLRLRWIREQVGPLAGRDILDLGCGGGILSEALAREDAVVTGLDLSTDALTAARTHAASAGLAIDYREQSAESMAAAEPESRDVVVCMEMLEHVPDPAAIVAAAGQITRPGGMLIFSTINRTPRAWLLAIVGAEYVLGLLPRGTHTYEQLIRPAELARWARSADLDATAETGLAYNPLLDHFHLVADTSVNYMMTFRKPGAEQ